MDTIPFTTLLPLIERIASALERLSPPLPSLENLESADAFLWQPETGSLRPVIQVAHVNIEMLKGVETQKKLVEDNTRHFAQGLPANNVMLWGARGMGKSSLVKAAHSKINDPLEASQRVILIEIQRDDLSSLPLLLNLLRTSSRKFILFCDDLSFEKEDADYKALKSVLDGGIAGRPDNVIFYATSNRRHLMPRTMIENESSTAINPSESVEEKVSLSDRFGLWIGFHNCSQETYFSMVETYAKQRNLSIDKDELFLLANTWSVTRGARSGRVAFQFIEDLTAKLHDR